MLGLADTDRARVEAAVKRAEQKTSAQFALVVAHAADDYSLYPILWSALSALAIGEIVGLAEPQIGTEWLAGLEAALFVVIDLVLHVRPIRHWTVPPRVKRVHAHRLARLEFAALVQGRTPDAVGILLFVSEAERHVEILTDRAIAAKIPETAWQGVIADFVAAVRADRVADAFIGAVEGATALLAAQFPPRPGATNTISNRVTEV